METTESEERQINDAGLDELEYEHNILLRIRKEERLQNIATVKKAMSYLPKEKDL